MMGLDNPIHLAFLLMILLLVFGAKRLPEMGRSLGVRPARLQGVDQRRFRDTDDPGRSHRGLDD